MIEVKKYYLPPTALVPNSPQPLLHYTSAITDTTDLAPEKLHGRFDKNGWETQWIFRYDSTQRSHYHSKTHECMVVLTGNATIRFGVADTDEDMERNTHGDSKEEGGVTLSAKPGDVFIIPAGVAHKTMPTTPSTFTLLTPGDGHGIKSDDPEKTLAEIKLSGYTMMGAYPKKSDGWDFPMGGEDEGQYEKIWRIPRPQHDPVLGASEHGICGHWQ